MAQRILVIDDEADLLELVRVNLCRAGFEVDLAATGREAFELLRRSPPDLILLDPERRRCFAKRTEISLTAKEFDLLHRLMARPGRVMTREHLLERVWGSDVVVTARTIDTHLKRLREKLGAAGALIETVRGVGYRFAE